jgi:heavy metal sensor kinase
MRLSIRWRLTLWNTLAVSLVLLGFAALVYLLTARALYEQTDRALAGGYQQLERDRRLANDPEERLRYWVEELHEHLKLFCVIYGPAGEVRVRTPELPADGLPQAPASAPDRLRFHDQTLPVLGRQRVLQGQLRLAGQELVVVLMSPLEEVDHELRRLLAALLTAIPLGLAVAGGLGYALARKALAPVEQLRRSTRDITADRLDRRLPVVNPDDELGKLAVTINDMIARLERSFAEVRRFTADASHELRTPLAAIRAEAEVALSRDSFTPGQQLLGSILEECERLTRLTDQLLELSRADAGVGRLEREPVDLAALLSRVVENLRPLADAKGLSLHADARADAEVCGDVGRLRQVFYNVLDNAIKYTPVGGRVDVGLELRGQTAVVTVRDTGIGIPAEHLPNVFERFYRVDKGRSREQGGTGLGLSISRSIVTAHGGMIELASGSGKGTSCTVTLPLATRPSPAREAQSG